MREGGGRSGEENEHLKVVCFPGDSSYVITDPVETPTSIQYTHRRSPSLEARSIGWVTKHEE